MSIQQRRGQRNKTEWMFQRSAEGCVHSSVWPCVREHPTTLSKDRKGPLKWKTLVDRARNLNQPMGMDSSGQVELFH